jgi:hypothetical protein
MDDRDVYRLKVWSRRSAQVHLVASCIPCIVTENRRRTTPVAHYNAPPRDIFPVAPPIKGIIPNVC